MDSPTSQSVASYLSNHMGFQSWLAQHANQDIASLHNDPELSKFREEYNQNLNLGKLRTDPAQNTNIDINTFMQGVEMVKNMGRQAQQGSNLDQLVANVNKSLLVAQNSLVDLVELLNQGFIGGGGESVDTNVPSSEEQGASGRLEHLSEVARQVLPQIEQAAQVFQSEMKYFSSFSAPQQMSVGEPVISKKVSVATKYITGIKSLQEAHDKVEQVYQFANEFPYFVLNYDGFKKLCNFKTACNNLKKDIEILQKI